MTSPTKAMVSRAQTQRLLTWMQQTQPRVYAGLVKRFTPAGQVAGLWDTLSTAASGLVNSVTNFMNSQGGQALVTAATPFLASKLEKRQLDLNIKRMQAGLPMQQYPVPVTQVDPNNPYGLPATTMVSPYDLNRSEIPTWVWFAGAAGVGLLLARRR